FFFFSSRRRHTRCLSDWSSDVCSSDLHDVIATSRSDEPHEAFLPYKWQKRPGNVRFKRVDLNHDLDALKALLAAERPTHVVNFRSEERRVGKECKSQVGCVE